MAVGFPTKANWAAGDVLTASAQDDLAGTLNLLSNASAATGSMLISNVAGTSFAYNANYAAGKNKILNGDMSVWQRGTSISLSNNAVTYAQDRFYYYTTFTAGTPTVTQQTFTPGAAPVAGYEGTYFARMTLGSATTYGQFGQRIEDVRTYAGTTVTLSFWARASVATTLNNNLTQNFGTGGSSSVTPSGSTSAAVTTSWQRFSSTVTLGSLATKTIGTNSYLEAVFTFTPTASQTLDIWGVQLETGSVVTAFATATGTLQGELAACQRYLPSIQAYNLEFASGFAYSTTKALFPVNFQVPTRIAPTGITVNSAGNFTVRNSTASQITCTALAFSTGGITACTVEATVASGLTAGNGTNIINGGSGTILFTGCEL